MLIFLLATTIRTKSYFCPDKNYCCVLFNPIYAKSEDSILKKEHALRGIGIVASILVPLASLEASIQIAKHEAGSDVKYEMVIYLKTTSKR
jgi:hypothetical protein